MKKYKIETYLPKEALERIKNCCMNWYEVNSSWRPIEGANPYQGKVGEIEVAMEYKIEFVCVEKDLKKAVQTIKANHPYEEVCINIIPLYEIY